ncbi:MAG: hypothetical protein HYV95_16770 [Opitutae bacterium]|nr:hypothetical protein [Opitutae bacterium]
MPLDYSFESTPSFRDLTHTGLLLLQKPLVRSVSTVRRLRTPVIVPAPAVVKATPIFRRSPSAGSLS